MLTSAGRLGTSLHITAFPASPDSYLLARVPNHVFDVLCVRVEDTDTLILILFVNCGRKKNLRADPARNKAERQGFPLYPEAPGLTFPDPHTLISAAGSQEVARRRPSH